MSTIVILTGHVQSGKTTTLLNKFSSIDSVSGFICPDVLGQRMIYFCKEKILMPFQTVRKDNVLSIGKFSFDKDVFNIASDILVNSSTLENDFIIIDEIGPMELKEDGFYQPLTILLDKWSGKENGTLILVVREHLVQDVISKFHLSNFTVKTKGDYELSQITSNKVNALILGGGESSRMKTDKFLLKYCGVEQYKRLQKMFSEMNMPVFLSCNQKQYSIVDLTIDKIVDDEKYKDAGPLTGILSAFDQLDSDLLIVGCDYPLLRVENLQILKQFSEYGFDEIAFVKQTRKEVVEPLICFLSKKTLQNLKQFYLDGGRSLNKYLQQINPLKIQLNDDTFLRSFDTPEDYHSYCNN